MSRYNGHFHSKFEGCMIVGRLRDEGRNREVTAYAIRGEPDVVGYYDGVDTWVGTASMAAKIVQQELAAVHGGQAREIEYGQTRRRLHDEPGIMGRPNLESMPGSRPRRRAVAESGAAPPPEPPRRERKRVSDLPGESIIETVRGERRRAR